LELTEAKTKSDLSVPAIITKKYTCFIKLEGIHYVSV
jgi:hypothetical protein